MAEDKYGFVVPCDNCILKVEHDAINKRLMEMTKELKLKEMRIIELEDACDYEAERCAKTNDARLAAERELEAEKSRAETIRKEAQDWKRRAEEWQNCYINCGVSRDKALMEIDELKKKLKDTNSNLEHRRKELLEVNDENNDLKKEVEEWKAKYEDLRCETLSRIRTIWEHAKKYATPGITTAKVFDPAYFTPGRLFKAERFRWNGDLVEEVNVVIIALSGENTRLECRSMDKDNAEVFINVNKVLDGTKNGIVLTPIKVVEEDTQ